MLTKQEMFLDFLGAPDAQFIIPVYQRVYAWNDRQCDTLWNDVLRAGRTGAAHFIGTVLFAAEDEEGGLRRIDVIDGQQRTATVTLLLAALRDYLRESGITLASADAGTITDRYLHQPNAPEGGKLLLSRIDRATMTAVLEGTELPEEDDLSANVVENYRRFRLKMAEGFTPADAEVLWAGLQRLLVIAAELDGSDRPQLIFESLNSKGMPLTTADLVRNLMLVNVGLDEQTRLYERYWAPIEQLYRNDTDSTRLNAALHGWLAITAPQLHVGSKDEVYAAFKTYLETIHKGTLEELLIGLKGFCETFAAKSQGTGSASANLHADLGTGTVKGIISEKKLFGD